MKYYAVKVRFMGMHHFSQELWIGQAHSPDESTANALRETGAVEARFVSELTDEEYREYMGNDLEGE